MLTQAPDSAYHSDPYRFATPPRDTCHRCGSRNVMFVGGTWPISYQECFCCGVTSICTKNHVDAWLHQMP